MEWRESPELDRALWRNCHPKRWSSYPEGKGPRAEWVRRKFREFYPLSGDYSLEVMERAVWRETERRKKRREKR
jgi:hypothetical protein